RGRKRPRLAGGDVGDASASHELRGSAGHDTIGRRPPEDSHVDRRVAGIEAGPGRARLEVLIDKPVAESGKGHALGAPLAEANAVAPSVTAETHGSGRRRRWTGRCIRRASASECGLRRLGLIAIEGRLQRAALPLQTGESNQRLTPLTVELAVITGDLGHLARN